MSAAMNELLRVCSSWTCVNRPLKDAFRAATSVGSRPVTARRADAMRGALSGRASTSVVTCVRGASSCADAR